MPWAIHKNEEVAEKVRHTHTQRALLKTCDYPLNAVAIQQHK
jgi:hypothetical protein